MTADNSSSHKKTSYKGVIVFGIIALFIYEAWTKARVDNCLTDARAAYEQDWAAACKTTAKSEREAYANCMNIPGETASICRSVLNPKRDASANCALPAKSAEYIDSQLDKAKNFCVSYG